MNILIPIKKALLISSAFFCICGVKAQDTTDLFDMFEDEPQIAGPVTNEFKTSTVINLQSLMMTAGGEWDFKINHRFGALNEGAYNAFGLDNSNVRIGGEFGITDHFNLGIARSGYQKMTDVFAKYKILSQTTDNKKPLSIIGLFSTAYTAQEFGYTHTQGGRKVDFLARLAYTGQIILGRKFGDNFSTQISPSVVHYNISNVDVDNTLYALGLAARLKLSGSTTFNAEYIPVFGDKGNYKNSLSMGFDIETGGHIFQLHLTNSTGMAANQFIARNVESWDAGGIHFGFNISRVFSL